MNQKINKKNKIDELESIRGLAALVVVMYHIPGWHPFLHHISFIRGGGLMVDLFFVLSGFVIFCAYGDRLESGAAFIKFQFLRLGRLYPVHLVFLLVYLLIETLKYILQTHYGIQSHSKAPFLQNDFAAFLREVFLVKAFWPNETAMAFNSPAWSISAEFYTYILFGLIVLYLNKFKLLIFTIISVVCIATLILYKPEEYNFMLRCLSGFFIGCLAANAVKRSNESSASTYGITLNAWLIPLSMFLIVWITSQSKGYFGISLLIYPLTALLIASITLSKQSVFKDILAHKSLVWLGTVSYSLYMSHGAVLWCFQQCLRVVFHRPELMVRDISTPQFHAAEAGFLMFAFIAICLLISQLTFMYIEKPFREKSRDFVNTSNY
ncbi:acyltransferase family protein [Methylophilus flavus]|uniref:Acyltransferase family protein n=1 Tax=Methylophilus flavus TaxID=640084 RepID=A0ABW3P5L9_9PROT